jgi:hypothetical protein
MSENPLILLALDAAWSCSNADAPAFKHVDLQGSLVDLEAAKIQIAAVAMVNLAHPSVVKAIASPLDSGNGRRS